MNVIVIVLDSLRQDHVSYYHGGRPAFEGVDPCRTPNLDTFAQECLIFDNAYPEALPTIPIRIQLFTGQRTLPFRPWQPLTTEDITIAEILRDEGYVCGLISDVYHYRAPGMNYHRGFHAYRWIRGQEFDPWTSHPPRRDISDYVNDNFDENWRSRIAQFLSNTDQFTGPGDWFPASVVDEAITWLEFNREHDKLFAWIDCFDPHEPWDPPDEYDTYTNPSYHGKRLIMPMGGIALEWATAEEIQHIRGLYAGEVSFVDQCLGRLFRALEDGGFFDDSIILVLADHGHPLADHGKFLKGGDRLYNELLKVPFLIRLPGGKGARRSLAIVQFHDLLPTLLELLGLGNNVSSMHGRSFKPVLQGDSDEHRKVVITGFHEAEDRCIRDHRWSFIQRPGSQPDELFDLIADPRERNNLIDEYPGEAIRLSSAFGGYFRSSSRKTVIKGLQGKYELSSGAID